MLLRPEVRSGSILAGRPLWASLGEADTALWLIKLTPGELVKIEMLQTLQELQMRKGEQHLVLPRPTPAPSTTVCSYLYRTISGLLLLQTTQTHLRSGASPVWKALSCDNWSSSALFSPTHAVL